MRVNRRFLLIRRPVGLPAPDDFRLAEEPAPELAPGEFLIRNTHASLDPAIRGWMSDAPSYMPPIPLGAPVRASTIGRVAASRNPAFPEGAWVTGLNAIEDYSLGRSDGFTRVIDPAAVPRVTNYLSAAGTIGLTAYLALMDVGRPRPGETLLVSGAAGAVGSLVGQIAARAGLRAIAVAGGPEKAARCVRDYGYAAAIDYRGKDAPTLLAEIRAAAPDGIDIHFENTGGPVLDAALLALRPRGRVILCGLISEYNARPEGARNLWQLIVTGGRMEGFILTQHVARFAEVTPILGDWLRDGSLKVDEHIDHGIENALPAFLRLFEGTNRGKMILALADEGAA